MFVLPAMVLALTSPAGAPTQDAPPPSAKKSAPHDDIFSGTVTELSDESLTVVRSALALQTVKRTFHRDAQTVIEGQLHAKARVTVRYSMDEAGQFHALHIIVR